MKIFQASYGLDTDTGKSLLAKVLSLFQLFQVMEFSQEPFSYLTYPAKPDVGDDDNSARVINADAKKFTYAPTSGSGTQRAYSFEYWIDAAYLADLKIGAITNEGLRRQLQNEQLRLFVKLASDVLYDMMNGDGAAPHILGLKTFIKDTADETGQTSVFGFTQAQLFSSLVQVSMTLDLNNVVQLRKFDELLTRVLAEMAGSPTLVMNSLVFARMTQIAKVLNMYGTTLSDFGKPIDMYGNYKMVPVPLKYLPNTETDGENTDLNSIFVIDYDEATGVRYATNTGFAFQDFDVVSETPSGKTRADFVGNLKCEDIKQIRRLSRIKL
ncbi:TPA: hypothetical protein DD449_02590 [Candidatus Berkelbacteria bacterium]|nr:hypothetical protein [Candidatus Berkelbacteria bacterium]